MKKMLLILLWVPFICVAMEGQGDQSSSNAVAPESPRTMCKNRLRNLEERAQLNEQNLLESLREIENYMKKSSDPSIKGKIKAFFCLDDFTGLDIPIRRMKALGDNKEKLEKEIFGMKLELAKLDALAKAQEEK